MNEKNESTDKLSKETENTPKPTRTVILANKNEKAEPQSNDKSKSGKRENNIDRFFSNLTAKMPLPDLLKKQLQGVVFCKIDGHDSDYVIDLRADKFLVLKRSELQEELKYDCTVKLKKYDIEELIMGELNPQIAMLSHKIQVTGSMNMAMYFFNLFE